MSFFSSLDTTSLALGVAIGAIGGAFASRLVSHFIAPFQAQDSQKLKQKAPTVPTIDHVVVRCQKDKNGKIVEDAIKFYTEILGFEPDRLDQYRRMVKEETFAKPGQPIVFPSARLNDNTVIDLFPTELEPLFCESSVGQVDHMCLCYPSVGEHIACLERLQKAGIKLKTYGKPWGARGQGFSTYLLDPSGLYLELRNYETEQWDVLEKWLVARDYMGAKPMPRL